MYMYFSRTAIPALYMQVREKIHGQLRHIKFFSATTDLWSSTTMEPYLSFTVHYIHNVDDNWKVQSTALHTLYMRQDHTGLNLAEVLCETLETWELSSENLVCLTTDSGINIHM